MTLLPERPGASTPSGPQIIVKSTYALLAIGSVILFGLREMATLLAEFTHLAELAVCFIFWFKAAWDSVTRTLAHGVAVLGLGGLGGVNSQCWLPQASQGIAIGDDDTGDPVEDSRRSRTCDLIQRGQNAIRGRHRLRPNRYLCAHQQYCCLGNRDRGPGSQHSHR